MGYWQIVFGTEDDDMVNTRHLAIAICGLLALPFVLWAVMVLAALIKVMA